MTKIVGRVAIVAGGTPQQLSASTLVIAALGNAGLKKVQGVILQACHDNLGRFYIGTSSMVKATLVGVGYTLGIPAANVTAPALELKMETTGNGVDLSELWLDGTTGEAVNVIISVS